MSSIEAEFINTFGMITILTDYDTEAQTNINLTQVIIPSIVIFLEVSSNFLIVLDFALEKRLRVYTNYYVVNMAIADSLVGLVAMGFHLGQSLMNFRWPFGHISCSIIMSITHTLLHVSVVMIAVISIDRCYEVYYPLLHLRQRRNMNAIRRNILVWVVCFIFWGSFIGVWRQMDEARHLTVVCGPLYNRNVVGTLVVASVYYWIPATITGVINF
ncbi:Octopamine receptor beta-3R [Holothuria leucospilota]|uniref:Octopamine receptor beta-3R n=1 Tax=Holothuria leucospilota TaxID=206669 RepID=A0A9Q1H1F1_HOLLE|nr:Octopamine receptor beta-3R [Holothuria leucospilota]